MVHALKAFRRDGTMFRRRRRQDVVTSQVSGDRGIGLVAALPAGADRDLEVRAELRCRAR